MRKINSGLNDCLQLISSTIKSTLIYLLPQMCGISPPHLRSKLMIQLFNRTYENTSHFLGYLSTTGNPTLVMLKSCNSLSCYWWSHAEQHVTVKITNTDSKLKFFILDVTLCLLSHESHMSQAELPEFGIWEIEDFHAKG